MRQPWINKVFFFSFFFFFSAQKRFCVTRHKYTVNGNPLYCQLKYDPQTGEILEIYEQPTGRTDAVSMQHDVDYSVCGNKPKSEQVKCKNEADRKMVK